MKTLEVAQFRKRFPILQHYIQLSSCSQSAMHEKVKQAVDHYMESWETQGMDWAGWMAAVEEARERFAALIHAEPDDVAVVSSVSHAASAIAASLEFSRGKPGIVLTEMDFPCIGHVWLSQADRGAQVKFIAMESGHDIPLEKYEETIDEHTLLASVSHAAYYNGFKQDIRQIAEIAHRKGALLFVDAYQSAGNAEIDVKENDVDFLAAGMQKYLLGIPGIAFLYIKRSVADELKPRVTGWFGQARPFAFDIKSVEYAKGARKFDSGTPPMISGFAAKAALEVIQDIGVVNIETYLRELADFTINYALENGLEVKSPKGAGRGASIAVFAEKAGEVEARMKKKGVIVSARNDVIRIAPHFYNTKEDVKIAVDLLRSIISP
jgi:selenocysteine lyase/cysteine desulfurase